MSLSLSDLLIATFGIPMDFTAALTFGWKMGEAACVFTGFVLTFLGNIKNPYHRKYRSLDHCHFLLVKINPNQSLIHCCSPRDVLHEHLELYCILSLDFSSF